MHGNRGHSLIRGLGKGAAALLLIVTFVLALVVSALIHLSHPSGRSIAVSLVNQTLATSFKGKVVIDRIDGLGLGGVSGVDASIYDLQGRRVIAAQGVSAEVDTLTAARSFLQNAGPLRIVISELTAKDVNVTLLEEAPGQPSIARAFEPREPKPEDPNARATRIEFQNIAVEHIGVRGGMQAVPVVHADLSSLDTALTLDESSTHADLRGVRIAARKLPQVGSVAGQLQARALVPGEKSAAEPKVSMAFDGAVAAIPVQAQGRLDARQLSATATVGPAAPEKLRQLVPGFEVRDAVSAQVSVHGSLDADLQLRGHVAAGPGVIDLDGRARLVPNPEGQVTAKIRRLDVSSLQASAPRTALSANAKASFATAGDVLRGDFQVQTEPLVVNAQPVPALRVSGDYDPRGVRATVHIDEPGLPTRIDAVYDALASTSPETGTEAAEVEFRIGAEARDLRELKRLPGAAGQARINGSGRLTLGDTPLIEAQLQTELRRFTAPGVAARSGDIVTRATGSLAKPALDVRGHFEQLKAGNYAFERVSLAVTGDPDALRIDANTRGGPGASIRALAQFSPTTSHIENAKVVAVQREHQLELSAKSIRLGPPLRVEGVQLTGAGELNASATMDGQTNHVVVDARELDLGALAAVAGIKDLGRGKASLSADVKTTPRGIVGKVKLDARRIAFDDVKRGRVEADLQFEPAISGTVVAGIGRLVNIKAEAKRLELPADLNDPAALSRTQGELDLDSTADLSRLARYVDPEQLPWDKAEGLVKVRLKLARTGDTAMPTLQFSAQTYGLTAVGKTSPEPIETANEARARQPWRVADVDLKLAGELNGETRQLRLETLLHDAEGTLATVEFDTTVPPQTLEDPGSVRWQELPVRVRAEVPPRELADLPPLIRPATTKGELSARMDLTGTMNKPKLELMVEGQRLRSKDETAALPSDLLARATYDGERGALNARVFRNRRTALELRSEVLATVAQLMRIGSPESEIKAQAVLEADQFPVHSISLVKDRQITGFLKGQLAITGLGEDGRLNGDLELQQFAVGQARFKSARIQTSAKDGQLLAKARFEQADGFAEAGVNGKLLWGRRLVPELVREEGLTARAKAQNFRAAAVLPLVEGAVSTLDGRIDADVAVRTGGAQDDIRGFVAFDKGVVQVPSIGQEFRDIQARVVMREGGDVQLERASARGLTGRVRAQGNATLEGLALKNARLRASIAKGEELPLTLEGVSVGDAYGSVDVVATSDPEQRRTQLVVKVPAFHLDLPETAKNQVQPLEDDPRILTGVYLEDRKFAALPLQPLQKSEPAPSDEPPQTMRVTVDLGNDVWVRKGTQLRVRLKGKIQIDVEREARVTGQIQLARGTLDVQGKQFEIERGLVTFQPDDPSNPIVLATARWDAPDGTQVFADFVGPVKHGDLKLRSDPPLQENEIISLILFGSPDGQFGVSGGDEDSSSASTALSVGGGAATQGLNKALGDLTSLDVQTRIDTSSGSPQPEVAFQVSRRLTAELGYNVGEPGPGQPRDRTFLTLDFRVKQNWSLSTTVGDRGSTMWDALWRYRY